MKMVISKPETWGLDSTIFTSVVATIAERRLGDFAVARMHLSAAISLLHLRGGLKAIQDMEFPAGMIVLYAIVSLEGAQVFRNPSSLRTASRILRRRLRIFQNWSRKIRTEHALTRQESTASEPMGPENLTKQDSCLPGSLRYFGSSSVLRPYVESSFADRHPSQLRSYLAVAYAITSMLWAFRDSEEEAAELMDKVVHQVELSQPSVKDSSNSTATPNAGLTMIALLFVLANEASNLGHWNSSDDAAFRSWDIIEFVELMTLASHHSTKRITAAMASWLTTDINNQNGLVLVEDSDFDVMEDEIKIGYFANNDESLSKTI